MSIAVIIKLPNKQTITEVITQHPKSFYISISKQVFSHFYLKLRDNVKKSLSILNAQVQSDISVNLDILKIKSRCQLIKCINKQVIVFSLKQIIIFDEDLNTLYTHDFQNINLFNDTYYIKDAVVIRDLIFIISNQNKLIRINSISNSEMQIDSFDEITAIAQVNDALAIGTHNAQLLIFKNLYETFEKWTCIFHTQLDITSVQSISYSNQIISVIGINGRMFSLNLSNNFPELKFNGEMIGLQVTMFDSFVLFTGAPNDFKLYKFGDPSQHQCQKFGTELGCLSCMCIGKTEIHNAFFQQKQSKLEQKAISNIDSESEQSGDKETVQQPIEFQVLKESCIRCSCVQSNRVINQHFCAENLEVQTSCEEVLRVVNDAQNNNKQIHLFGMCSTKQKAKQKISQIQQKRTEKIQEQNKTEELDQIFLCQSDNSLYCVTDSGLLIKLDMLPCVLGHRVNLERTMQQAQNIAVDNEEIQQKNDDQQQYKQEEESTGFQQQNNDDYE